ncbi:uncharacterized protein CDV56_101692 [Aspergillus thermomutatus]|uniref:Uncharacterized protein n=1 Tax=Aspergillus thermomutatus TaxID=41047 RepID=A0A397HMQ7_ASPTH|nr:uncharacterized protein CDV56_101692 [Aspergillus thermomutatus]RHZ64419.1 hypothetical protein CDV56_101692 [Aspergillus thermomutatus]
MEASRPATNLEQYPTTPDEAIANVHLVLLIQELIDLRRSSSLECTITRVRFVPKFGTNSFSSIVDDEFFKYAPEDLVQVDIIPQYLPPYLPAHAMALRDIDLNYLPFIAPLDLLAYKVHCSSMRP